MHDSQMIYKSDIVDIHNKVGPIRWRQVNYRPQNHMTGEYMHSACSIIDLY